MEQKTKIVDPVAPWNQAQQAFWERWRAAMENGMPQAVPPASLWNLPLEFWKAAIYESLEIQLAAAEAWKAWFCANDANIPELTLGACQTIHFAEDWTRSQMQLWDAWFAALESLAPGIAEAPAHAKPRAHAGARRHDRPVHAQSHNGASARSAS